MNNKKNFLLILGLVLLVFGIFAAFKLTAKDEATTSTETELSQTQPTQTPSDSVDSGDVQGSQKLTLEEVKKHSTADDCWTVISDNVYDITDYVSSHPGGNVIIQACGTDGTTLFTERKTSDGDSVGSGTPHDAEAKSLLNDYLLGPLEN
jgi:cytochrome b involved in lipid metabolism